MFIVEIKKSTLICILFITVIILSFTSEGSLISVEWLNVWENLKNASYIWNLSNSSVDPNTGDDWKQCF